MKPADSVLRSIQAHFLTNLLAIPMLMYCGIAHAEITPTRDALALVRAIADRPSVVVGASFLSIPPNGNPAALSTSQIAEFPTSGSSFAILSTGDATIANKLNSADNSGTDNGGSVLRGARDVTVLKIDLDVPADVSCLSMRYRFLSEEFPEFVGSQFNDAFIAELDNNTWDAGTSSTPTITAPNNFAFDASGKPISVNSVGDLSVSPESATGTTYDAATRRLRASTPITPGAHSLYLTIFDQGDAIYDSAAFIDRLTLSNLSPCTPGAAVDLTPLTPAGIVPLSDGTFSIPSTSVFLPSTFTIDRVIFLRKQVRSGGVFSLRVRVADTRGFLVRGARVDLRSVPSDHVTGQLSKKTRRNGVASFSLKATNPAFIYVLANRPEVKTSRKCSGVCAARLTQLR